MSTTPGGSSAGITSTFKTLGSTPLDVYQQRLKVLHRLVERGEVVGKWLANARLAVGVAGLILATAALGWGWVSPWWLALPVVLFLALVQWDSWLAERTRRGRAGVAFYERGLARLKHHAIRLGESGSRFIDPEHPYSSDLDLFGPGSLFERINIARTLAGEHTLASWLLSPATLDEIADRQEAVIELRDRLDLREDLARLGAGLRAQIEPDVLVNWATREQELPTGWVRIAVGVISGFGIASLFGWLLGFWNLQPLLGVIVVEIVVAAILAARVRRVVAAVESRTRDLGILAALLERVEREPFTRPQLLRIQEALHVGPLRASRCVRQLAQLVDRLEYRRNPYAAPLTALALWGTQHALAIEAWRSRWGRSIPKWLTAIGEFEALASLASYTFENPEDAFPEVVEAAEAFFEAEGLAHPLIERSRAVINDVQLTGQLSVLIVSGSNMSGKSTLLRSIGANVVLAQAGGPVRAKALRMSRLMPGGTIRIQDSLQAGRSRFYAEIIRLRQLVDLAGGEPPLLFLIDEMLHGTNSSDRRQGAEAILLGLLERGAIGLITTHDLALAEIADRIGSRAANVHFEDTLENGELSFDYRMRPGVVTKSNALALMRAVGLNV